METTYNHSRVVAYLFNEAIKAFGIYTILTF